MLKKITYAFICCSLLLPTFALAWEGKIGCFDGKIVAKVPENYRLDVLSSGFLQSNAPKETYSQNFKVFNFSGCILERQEVVFQMLHNLTDSTKTCFVSMLVKVNGNNDIQITPERTTQGKNVNCSTEIINGKPVITYQVR